jgi:hypothetical protein
MHDDGTWLPGERAGDDLAAQSDRYSAWSTDTILSLIAVLERELTYPAVSQQQRASGAAEDDFQRRLQTDLVELRRELVRREGA